MDLKKYLSKADISISALSRKLGHASPGLVSQVASGKSIIPRRKVPSWAAALNLEGDERQRFINEASADAIPDWTMDRLRELEARAVRAERLAGAFKAMFRPEEGSIRQMVAAGELGLDQLIDLAELYGQANRRLAAYQLAPDAMNAVTTLREAMQFLMQNRDAAAPAAAQALRELLAAMDAPSDGASSPQPTPRADARSASKSRRPKP